MKNSPPKRDSLMARSASAEVIALQRKIFKRHRKLIESQEAHLTKGFRKYQSEYRNAVSGFIGESGFGALSDAVARARIAYVADYHTLRLAQKTFLMLIQSVLQQADNICLALEFIDMKYQEELDRYLLGKISETTFLTKIEYKKQWPYDIWPNFKPIFDLAIEQGIPIIGIDSDSSLSLRKRDSRAAGCIAQMAKSYPAATIFVYAGQMHVAPSHLPAKVDLSFIKNGMSTPERVIVYQNAEEIYWQLAAEGREELEVVQVAHGEYCVNNTPPLVQQLSYIHWIQYDEEIIEYSELEDTVKSLIVDIGKYLKLDIGDAAKNVRVLMPGDLDLLDLVDEANVGDYSKKQILRIAESEESLCICELKLIYLATMSVNHAAEEAAHYVKCVVSGCHDPASTRDLFYYIVLNEACAFFASKIINPKRKADHEGRLRTLVAQARQKDHFDKEDRAAQFALEHLVFERSEKKKSLKSAEYLVDIEVFTAAAHFLGYILGDRLYYALTDGMIPKKTIRDLFKKPLHDENEAIEKYMDLSTQLRGVKIPRRM